jgi:hypothetical protein
VDYRILRRPTGHLDLLADLVNEELRSQTRAEVVLFLGPLARFTDKVPNRDLGSQREGPLPRFLYLQYRPLLRYPEAALGDSIQRAVSALKGRTVVVRSPGDLAKAIEMVEGK